MKKSLAAIAAAAIAGGAVIAVPALGSGAKTVSITDFKYTPKKLTVKKGTKVTWKWGGEVVHDVTVTKGPRKFHSSLKSTGTYSQVLSKPGTYRIVCSIHELEGMVMTIVVKKK